MDEKPDRKLTRAEHTAKLLANPRFVKVPPWGTGFIIGGQPPAHPKPAAKTTEMPDSGSPEGRPELPIGSDDDRLTTAIIPPMSLPQSRGQCLRGRSRASGTRSPQTIPWRVHRVSGWHS
jgi:hypothetical protein